MTFKERQLDDYLKKDGWVMEKNDNYPYKDKLKNKELVADILKYRLDDRGQKVTTDINNNFMKRFQPAFDYGTGDGLVYDTKHKQFRKISHEGNIENILPELKKEDWWKEAGIDQLNIKPKPWYKKILS